MNYGVLQPRVHNSATSQKHKASYVTGVENVMISNFQLLNMTMMYWMTCRLQKTEEFQDSALSDWNAVIWEGQENKYVSHCGSGHCNDWGQTLVAFSKADKCLWQIQRLLETDAEDIVERCLMIQWDDNKLITLLPVVDTGTEKYKCKDVSGRWCSTRSQHDESHSKGRV